MGISFFVKGKCYITRGIFFDVIIKFYIVNGKYINVKSKHHDVILQ
jgi:hypothetical protein